VEVGRCEALDLGMRAAGEVTGRDGSLEARCRYVASKRYGLLEL